MCVFGVVCFCLFRICLFVLLFCGGDGVVSLCLLVNFVVVVVVVVAAAGFYFNEGKIEI